MEILILDIVLKSVLMENLQMMIIFVVKLIVQRLQQLMGSKYFGTIQIKSVLQTALQQNLMDMKMIELVTVLAQVLLLNQMLQT